MKVLFLCNKSPFPPREGGPLAMNANIRALLKGGHQVKVLALNTNKYFINDAEIPEDYKQQTGIELIYKDLSIKPLKAFLNLFSDKSFHVERFISGAFNDRLIQVLSEDQYDIVQLEMLYMTPYLETVRKHSSAKVVLRSHNIEHLIWERITEKTSNPLKKAYLGHLTAKLKAYELRYLNRYDGILTISEHDAGHFRRAGCTIPLDALPFGVDIDDYQPAGSTYEYPSLFHIGSMNWMPNEEGIKWFIEEAWPLIHEKYPDLKLYLAGRMMPDWLNELKLPNVEVLGEVPDAGTFIRSKAVMVVPLFSGSGIRIKIIEGMALGKAIISTAIGAEGIHYTNGRNILIADDAPAFLEAVGKCLTGKDFCDALGKEARDLIAGEHSLEKVLKKLESFYGEITEKS
jgi:glycosyltransferase involved in cell wall biosynthesis